MDIVRSSLTEETASTPGWVDGQIDALFAPFGTPAAAAREAYAACLGGVRGDVDVDLGHDRCRLQAVADVQAALPDHPAIPEFARALLALEAEISAST